MSLCIFQVARAWMQSSQWCFAGGCISAQSVRMQVDFFTYIMFFLLILNVSVEWLHLWLNYFYRSWQLLLCLTSSMLLVCSCVLVLYWFWTHIFHLRVLKPIVKHGQETVMFDVKWIIFCFKIVSVNFIECWILMFFEKHGTVKRWNHELI